MWGCGSLEFVSSTERVFRECTWLQLAESRVTVDSGGVGHHGGLAGDEGSVRNVDSHSQASPVC